MTATIDSPTTGHVTCADQNGASRQEGTIMKRIFTTHRMIIASALLMLGLAFIGAVLGWIESEAVRITVFIGLPAAVAGLLFIRSKRIGGDDGA